MTVVPPGLVRMVRDRVLSGDVTMGHFWKHAQEQHFGLMQIRDVILTGQTIDWMRDRQRLLFCGRTRNDYLRLVWLHVVVDYTDPIKVGIITAYVPDPTRWEEPPLQRRR
jgi:hypothetical protein